MRDLIERLTEDVEMLKDGYQENLTIAWHSTVMRHAAKDIQEALQRLVESQAMSVHPQVQKPAVALPDGWIEWIGGECPVGRQDTVSFLRRSGEMVESIDCADDFNWGRYDRDMDTDIIGYRIDPA